MGLFTFGPGVLKVTPSTICLLGLGAPHGHNVHITNMRNNRTGNILFSISVSYWAMVEHGLKACFSAEVILLMKIQREP